MANLRNRNGKWQVQVRRLGHSPQARSFLTKSEAHRWARQTEAELDKSFASGDVRSLRGVTIADILQRYRKTVTSLKRGKKSEAKRIGTFLREDWSKLPMSHATPLVFSQFRDRRSLVVSPGTIIRELGLLRAIFETAKMEWGIPLVGNPLASVKKPRAPEGRTRRLLPGELEALLEASFDHNDGILAKGILLAIETGMRRGELLGAIWNHFNGESSTLHLPLTKTDKIRTIPLSERASALIESQRRATNEGNDRIFPMSANAFQQAWQRCKKRAIAKGCHTLFNLHFHDLRHEAVSRFFELGLNPAEVALISGHRDMRMLLRYTHLKAENLVKRLRNPIIAPTQLSIPTNFTAQEQ